MIHSLKSSIKNEKGSQLIEFVAVFPMVIMAALLIWQMALVAYAVVVTEAAARDGARVASVEGDYASAVESSAQGINVVGTSQSISGSSYGESVTVTVTADVPTVQVPFVGNIDYQLNADATMPMENDDDKEN